MGAAENRVKYLIIRFSSIGDIVLTTPVMRNLKQQVKGAEIHYLTKKAFAPILKSNPYIDQVHELSDFGPLMKKLKSEKFDYIIDLHNNLRSSRVKLALKKMNFTFNKLNRLKWLFVNFKINKMPNMHIVDRYLETIKLFIEEPDEKGLDYFLAPEDTYTIKDVNNYVVVVIGANHMTKQMPVNKLIMLCNQIEKPTVLIGGKGDLEKANTIAKESNRKIINLTGQLTINQSASVIKNASWIISPDTGMMHIASAFGKKIISYWGNTVPEFGMFPYKPDHQSIMFETKGLKCRPCSKIGYEKCPKKHFDCIKKLDESAMAKIANS